MPPNPIVVAGGGAPAAAGLLTAGIRTAFVDAYKRDVTEIEAQLQPIMDLGLPSDKLTETYPYLESAPHVRRWPRGEALPTENMRDRAFSVVNHDWAVGVDWHENDEQDDQTRSLVSGARDAGLSFAILPERVFFQIITAAADLALLPAVPNAPDGAALYSATDGAGAARFGVAGGNTFAGGGLTTADIVQDTFTAISRMRRFLDTKGQPLWQQGRLRRFTIIYNAVNEQAFAQAFAQRSHLGQVLATGGISNVFMDAGVQFRLWGTPRIVNNVYTVWCDDVPKKAIFQQVRQELRDNLEDWSNSDRTRRTKFKRVQWDARFGFGVALPYQTVQVTL